MNFPDSVQAYWPVFISLATLGITGGTAFHIILKKRNTRSAVGWLGLVWFAPVLGVCLYWLFGVNRIKRRARLRFAGKQPVPLPETGSTVSPGFIAERFGEHRTGLTDLSRLTTEISRQPILQGNRIEPLPGGGQAFDRMLSAIAGARHSIALATYIFDNDHWGKKFRAALAEAKNRGVEVRVLIDGVGANYTFPPITWGLRRDGVPVACFMQTVLPWRFRYVNLRNHRKILVVDGETGFTGGMNIRSGNVIEDNPAEPIQDVHFLIRGPVVAELQQTFVEDWTFTTGERLTGPEWFPELSHHGMGAARGIADGPDEDFDKLRFVIMGALASARSSIQVMTPYFLPDEVLLTSLRVAALRGVDVRIFLPGTSNLRMVKWASDAGLEELIDSGCRISLTPPPFDHSKLMVVDSAWVLLGSANWDPRSLALNFEFNLECYDTHLARAVEEIIARKVERAEELTLRQLQSISLPVRMRNNFFRLFAPYL